MEGIQRGGYGETPQADQILNYNDGRTIPVPNPDEQAAPINYDGKWNISITRMDHGYMVSVGCKKFAIESKHSVLKALDAYLSNPEKVAQDYLVNGNLPL